MKMIDRRFTVSGTGCALADYLHTNINFDAENFAVLTSHSVGDGGLCPGKLVFTEELERFAGKPYSDILASLTGGRQPAGFNIGGPGLVSMINASQLLDENEFNVRFFGALGNDKTADLILSKVAHTPLESSNFIKKGNKQSPFTDVLSDPHFDKGNGERTFINNIGAAWDFSPELIPEDFFSSQIICFGGTALVPQIHDNLTGLLVKGKKNNCITIVNTVFDFRNEKRASGKPWPLVDGDDDYRYIDILIMDNEEALKISGRNTREEAAEYFAGTGISSLIITHGAKEIIAYTNGHFFGSEGLFRYPVSALVAGGSLPQGDTTGCGDNFAGGIIASVALQKSRKPGAKPSLDEAMILAVASGGFACSYLGGAYYESYRWEKFEKVSLIANEYRNQTDRNGKKV